jgi:hypothetical protein
MEEHDIEDALWHRGAIVRVSKRNLEEISSTLNIVRRNKM